MLSHIPSSGAVMLDPGPISSLHSHHKQLLDFTQISCKRVTQCPQQHLLSLALSLSRSLSLSLSLSPKSKCINKYVQTHVHFYQRTDINTHTQMHTQTYTTHIPSVRGPYLVRCCCLRCVMCVLRWTAPVCPRSAWTLCHRGLCSTRSVGEREAEPAVRHQATTTAGVAHRQR